MIIEIRLDSLNPFHRHRLEVYTWLGGEENEHGYMSAREIGVRCRCGKSWNAKNVRKDIFIKIDISAHTVDVNGNCNLGCC